MFQNFNPFKLFIKNMKHAVLLIIVTASCTVVLTILYAAEPVPPLEKPSWKLTFHHEFDGSQLDDHYWFSSYRDGRKIWFKQKGIESR
jgi:hypothetical protein